MKYLILLSHGHLASGMKHTVEMIAGQHDNFISFDAYVDGNQDVKPFMDAFLENHPGDEFIVVTDVLGGSVNNDILSYNHLPNLHIVTGMNAVLVLNLLLKLEEESEELVRECIEECKSAIMYFEKVVEKENDDF